MKEILKIVCKKYIEKGIFKNNNGYGVEIFGFDFIIDFEKNPILLEVNRNVGFTLQKNKNLKIVYQN